MSYKEFSYFYDYFNYNADYDSLYKFIHNKAVEHGVEKGIMCDLGCGTGEIAFRFNKAGYEVIAIDNSDEMLDVLFDKRDEIGAYDIQILKQDITELDMYGTVDLFTCTFDTVNHLEGKDKLQQFFNKVSLFIHPDGLFVFDANTPYKHMNILKNETFDLKDEEADCLWKNTLFESENKTKISININDKVSKEKYSEEFFEYYYDKDELTEMIEKSGMSVVELLDGETFGNLTEESQRYIFVVKSKKGK